MDQQIVQFSEISDNSVTSDTIKFPSANCEKKKKYRITYSGLLSFHQRRTVVSNVIHFVGTSHQSGILLPEHHQSTRVVGKKKIVIEIPTKTVDTSLAAKKKKKKKKRKKEER